MFSIIINVYRKKKELILNIDELEMIHNDRKQVCLNSTMTSKIM